MKYMNIKTDFDKWYEKNKESLTVLTVESKLRKAFEAGKEKCDLCEEVTLPYKLKPQIKNYLGRHPGR